MAEPTRASFKDMLIKQHTATYEARDRMNRFTDDERQMEHALTIMRAKREAAERDYEEQRKLLWEAFDFYKREFLLPAVDSDLEIQAEIALAEHG